MAIELHRRMVLMRTYDERSLVYHRHGRIGTYAIYWGHEAMQVGAVTALADDDWVLPSYRESAVGLMRGMDPANILAWWRGHPEGWWDPRDTHIGSVSIPVGSHVPHAVGCAWGERMQGRNTAALAFFGDGATSEGDVHEGMNFAAVLNLPVVLMCNNNQWAITTPIEKQTKAKALVDKAVGYGMHGVRVDGGDVLAVFEATHEAVTRGRAGDGPTFVEAVSYRPTLHATADD
ncbi:MAG: 3-methyl-2-oxobutanoate dehydrogenase, partial [Thermoleophilia bacterium]|nr:3-methyl-2-oxobutanoate dehydrogenase [Thermoleophilia bacterium]